MVWREMLNADCPRDSAEILRIWPAAPNTTRIDSHTFTGRTLKRLTKKLNPMWWFQNDDEQRLDDGTTDWYRPGQPQWLRRLAWELRNPFQNLRAYVIGVQDRNYTVVGRAPVLTVQRDDLQPPERGWQWCLLRLLLPLPFVSYSGSRGVFYAGWQPTGLFGFKATGWALYILVTLILAAVGAVLI
jgi:hypothetical protein